METEKKHPFQALAKAINEDPEYAWAWHCNIAMTQHPHFPQA